MSGVHQAGGQQRDEIVFVALAGIVVLAAWALRYYYVSVVEFTELLQGDAQRYMFYAVNLVRHGVFSGTPIWLEPIEPDSFRAPGFPVLLALALRIVGEEGDWLSLTMQWHAALGAATVLIAIVLARRFLPRGAALAVGTLAAVWPHHVAASAEMLIEVSCGFTVALSLIALWRAERRGSVPYGVLAGLAGSLAYLVNPVWLFLPALAAVAIALRGRRAVALAIVAGLCLAPVGWGLRDAALDSAATTASRARMNFVQGSWPQFLSAFQTRGTDAVSKAIVEAEGEEEALIAADLPAGLARIAARMATDPGYYVAWYLWRKPYLLWDWDIRLGIGDIYVARVRNSPYETIPVLRLVKRALKQANLALFLLAVGGAAAALWRARRRADDFAAPLLALAFVYVSVVYVILQAEPRYSVPFRFVEVSLAAYALYLLGRAIVAATAAKNGSDEAQSQGAAH